MGLRIPEARRLLAPDRSSFRMLFWEGEKVNVEAGRLSAVKVPSLAPVEAVVPMKD